MGALRFRWTFLGVLVLGIAVVDLPMLAYGYTTHFHQFSRENGPLENLQLVFLAVATLVFAKLIFRVTHAARLVVSGAAALCLQFFFREFETPIQNPVLEFMSNDPFLYLLAIVLGALILIQLYLNRAHIPAFLGWLMRIEWWPFLSAGILLVAGNLFEKLHLEVIEEMLELNAYVVLAITAAAAWYRTSGRARLAALGPI